MKTMVYADVAGFFQIDEKTSILHKELFPADPSIIADNMFNLSRYNNSSELDRLFKTILDEEIITNCKFVANFARSIGKKCDVKPKFQEFQQFGLSLPDTLIGLNFVSNIEEYKQLVREISIQYTKKGIAQSSQRVDKMVVHAILSMDDIDKVANLLSTRVREWYSVHFPELDKKVENHATYCKIITEIGSRKDFDVNKLQKLGFSSGKSNHIVNVAQKSMGAEFETKDLVPLKLMAQRTLELYEQRSYLEGWIEQQLDHVAPNMLAIAGPAITARLIALAGGLEELAKKPASTLQLLGAEKALFRSLKTGAKPPKHGVIFQMPSLHSCPWWQRGNIARAIAGKLTIAARVDAFKGEFIGTELRLEVDKKIEEIKKKYPKPPKKDTTQKQNRHKKSRSKRRKR